ncbi:MAG: flagellar protein FlgN [Bdellovibrionaceae bacterium]|nr:flagellar protein FlgN [Pseudobdellovibrionaceae bacterium]
MRDVLRELIDNLDLLSDLYREMRSLLRQEQAILLSANIHDLQNNNQQKERLLQKIALADGARAHLASQVAAQLGLSTEAPRLLDLAKAAPARQGEELARCYRQLESLITEISSLNRENEVYARSALKTLDGAMGNIRETLAGKGTYQRKGGYRLGPDQAGNFVSREA